MSKKRRRTEKEDEKKESRIKGTVRREPVCLPHPHKLHKIRGIFDKFDTVLGNG
jgi:hypothetical protein